jgi:hypothetical protein
MRFLLRMAFWLGVVLVLLPSGNSQPASKAAQVSASDAMSVASAAAADARQFCERKPDACVIGSHVAVALGYRAQAGAKMVYDFLTEQLGPAETGSVTPAAPRTATRPGRDTLTSADLGPGWRGPPVREDKRSDRRV